MTARRPGEAGAATLTGDPVDLLLYLYGRKDVAQVTLHGDDAAVGRVAAARFGV